MCHEVVESPFLINEVEVEVGFNLIIFGSKPVIVGFNLVIVGFDLVI